MAHFRGTTRRTLIAAHRVMAVLQHELHTRGRCPGVHELVRITGKPYSTLRYYLEMLRDDYGLITWERGRRNSIHILHTVSGGD